MARIIASAKESFREFLFNLETWKIGLFIAIVVLSLILIASRAVSTATAFVNWKLLGLYSVLVILLTFSRMPRFTRVGIKFSYFLLFMTTLTLGPLTAVVLRVVSVPIRLWMFLADLQFKSFLRTREDYIFKQWLYSAGAILMIWIFVRSIGIPVVASGLSFYYMLIYGIWTAGLLVLHILFPRGPVIKHLVSSGAGLVFNWFLVTSIGPWMYNYLAGFI